MGFVFALFKCWSVSNLNSIKIFYFFGRTENFVGRYLSHPRTRKLNEGEIEVLNVLSIKTGQRNPRCKLLSPFAGDEHLFAGKLVI